MRPGVITNHKSGSTNHKLRINILVLLILLTCVSFEVVYGQYTNRTEYDLKVPARDQRQKRCGKLTSLLSQLPPEVQFSTQWMGDSAYLVFNNAAIFWKFFEDKKDGFAIDLVNQDQFQCDNVQRLATSSTHKGFLLPPEIGRASCRER